MLHPSTRRWLALLRAEGFQALLQWRRGLHKPRCLGNIPHIRAEIAAALDRKPDWRLQLRLKAIDAVLTGQLPENAAAIAHVKTTTLQTWLARIRKHGIAAVIAHWQHRPRNHRRHVNARPAQLLALAKRHDHRPKIRKRLLALAYAAKGDLPVDDIAARLKLSSDTVRRTIRIYNTEGLGPLLIPAKKRGRPRKHAAPSSPPHPQHPGPS